MKKIFFIILAGACIIPQTLIGSAHTTPTQHDTHFTCEHGVDSLQGRRLSMEDDHACIDDYHGLSFFGVYDGHGGRDAAQFVAENLHKNILTPTTYNVIHHNKNQSLEEHIKNIVDITEKDFLDSEKKNPHDPGTTILAALIHTNVLTVINIGDSRAVISQHGKAIALSHDHTLSNPNEKKRLTDLGFDYKGKRVYSQNCSLAITRAFGDFSFKTLGVVTEAEITSVTIDHGLDFLILACDGLWDVLSNQEAVNLVKKSLAQHNDARIASETLVNHAYNQGSTDNITAIVVRFVPRKK